MGDLLALAGRERDAAIVDMALYAVMEASGGPADYVAKARAGNWPIWRAAHIAATLAFTELLDERDAMKAALEKIAGSHLERVGLSPTDIEDMPDLSDEEAMNVARNALSPPVARAAIEAAGDVGEGE